jgi:hypothetical protein
MALAYILAYQKDGNVLSRSELLEFGLNQANIRPVHFQGRKGVISS